MYETFYFYFVLLQLLIYCIIYMSVKHLQTEQPGSYIRTMNNKSTKNVV